MENIFYDLLRDGATPESLTDALNAALRKHEEDEARSKREAAMNEAAERAADALNVYASMVDPNWECLDTEDIEVIVMMSAMFRGALEGILDVMFSAPTCDPAQAVDIHVDKPKMTTEDEVIADFLSFLGV